MNITKSIHDITEDDLLGLITSQIREGKFIDYKLTTKIENDADKKELLADVSSFANASGGHIIFGMQEEDAVAHELVGIRGLNADAEVLRIDDIVRSGIAPRINGFITRPIPLSGERFAFISYIPKSWSSPHMVTFKNSSKIFTRTSAGKHQMDIGEIRQSILVSDTTSQKIREFILDRLSKIISEGIPLPINRGSYVIFHSIPLSSIQNPINVDLTREDDIWYLIPLMIGGGQSHRINLDGILTTNTLPNGKVGCFGQLFRNGIIESVDAISIREEPIGSKTIYANRIEENIITACGMAFRLQQQHGIEPPLVIKISFLNILGYSLFLDPRRPGLARLGIPNLIDVNDLILPEIMIESFADKPIDVVLRPIFDTLWNAAGWRQSHSYDENGRWKKS